MCMRDRSASALTTFIFLRALCASIFYLSPFFIYFTYLLVKAHAFIFLLPLRGYFLCHFYLPYINLIPNGIFRFSNEEDEHILRLRLIKKNNVRYVATLTYIESFTELPRSCQKLVAFFSSFIRECTRRFII